jgi:hypothetical protein
MQTIGIQQKLLCDDVDFVSGAVEFLRHLAVFATTSSTAPDQFHQGAFHWASA